MQKSTSVRQLGFGAVLAATYAALTLVLPIPQYGPIQLRPAEALTLLPFLYPAATPGLVLGCFLSNLFSPFPLDAVFGTLATLIACVLTRRMPNRYLAALPPVVCNGLLIGFEVAFTQVGLTEAFPAALALNLCTIAAGETVVCFFLGVPLVRLMEKHKLAFLK